MRDQIVAKLSELSSKLDMHEWEHVARADNHTAAHFDTQAIAAFIRCISKDMKDSELDSPGDTIKARSEQILPLEDESEEALETEKARSYWEEKEYFSASDIGVQLEISHSGAKVNKVPETLEL